jgi:hypothetical protein
VRRQLVQADPDDDQVQQQVRADQEDRKADRLLEALEEDRAQGRNQRERDADLAVPEDLGRERVLSDVRGGVGGREGDRDDEVSRHEAE